MNNYPLGANEDAKAPWRETNADFKECPECNGEGDFGSECCEAPIKHTICTTCKEHAQEILCGVCGGAGCVAKTVDDLSFEEDDEAEMNRDN